MAGNKIGIDLGGTYLRVALIRNNKILKYIKKKTPSEKNKLIQELFNTISELTNENKNITGIGIASPGPLKDGIIKNPPNLPLQNYNLKKEIQKKFKKRVEVENDASCVALAESKLGCKRNNFIILTLGTGIGGGIIINNELYLGQGYAGEFGHIILNNGEYFENLAAWKKIKKITKQKLGKETLIQDLIKSKNPKAKKILNEITMYLGQGIASLANAFDPEIVIISGGVRETGLPFLNMIKKQAQKYNSLPKKVPISWTKLDHPGVLGASLLV
tara:strand:- start:10424 stop:11245 length:822 start_codon:yes stop_codon:yes gene_type:complete